MNLNGLDFSADMLREARKLPKPGKSPFPEFVQGSVYEMPFQTDTFDVALNTISCHFYLEQVRAFREICRILKPGGRFYCAAITYGLRGRGSSLANIAVYYPPHILSDHFEEAGFKVIGYDRFPPNVALFRLVKP